MFPFPYRTFSETITVRTTNNSSIILYHSVLFGLLYLCVIVVVPLPRRQLEAPLDLGHLWNFLAGAGCRQKGFVVPSGVFANLVHCRFDWSLALGLLESLEIVPIAVGVGLVAQQIVECEFGKGNALVHGVQIVRVHGRDQLTN